MLRKIKRQRSAFKVNLKDKPRTKMKVIIFELECGHEGQTLYTEPTPMRLWCPICAKKKPVEKKEKKNGRGNEA